MALSAYIKSMDTCIIEFVYGLELSWAGESVFPCHILKYLPSSLRASRSGPRQSGTQGLLDRTMLHDLGFSGHALLLCVSCLLYCDTLRRGCIIGLSAQNKRREAAVFVCAVTQFRQQQKQGHGAVGFIGPENLSVGPDRRRWHAARLSAPTRRLVVLDGHPQLASGDFLCLFLS